MSPKLLGSGILWLFRWTLDGVHQVEEGPWDREVSSPAPDFPGLSLSRPSLSRPSLLSSTSLDSL